MKTAIEPRPHYPSLDISLSSAENLTSAFERVLESLASSPFLAATKIHSLDLLVGGTDETYMAPVYAHHRWGPKDVQFGRYYTNIIDADAGVMDLSRMHDTTADPHEVSSRASCSAPLPHHELPCASRSALLPPCLS